MAKARGVRIHARVAGFGAAHALVPPIPLLSATCDHACPTTKFDPAAVAAAGTGLARAITAALRDAGLTAADIDAAIPEGCGAPLPDQAEAFALREGLWRAGRDPSAHLPRPHHRRVRRGQWRGAGRAGCPLPFYPIAPAHPPPQWSNPPCRNTERVHPLRRILLCSMGVCGQCAAIVLEA